MGEGSVVVTGPDGDVTYTFAEFGRGADVAGMTAAALAAGRSGNPAERAISNARVALRGLELDPMVVVDEAAIAAKLTSLATSLYREPTEASVTADVKKGFTVTEGNPGRSADATDPIAEISSALAVVEAPSELTVDLPVTAIDPEVTTEEANEAKAEAGRVTSRIELTIGKQIFPIGNTRLRGWVTFAPTADGGYRPIVDTAPLTELLEGMRAKMEKPAVNASFTTSGSRITGVTESKRGYTLDVPGTIARIQTLLDTRTAGPTGPTLKPALTPTHPSLTTEEAVAVKSKMRKITRVDDVLPDHREERFRREHLDPRVDDRRLRRRAARGVQLLEGRRDRSRGPRATSRAARSSTAGPSPRARWPAGSAPAPPPCSTPRSGPASRWAARRNHYYYIDRYPLGLDATVFISGSGSVQDMTWTNDTDYPVLIRGYKIRNGNQGYVKFALYQRPERTPGLDRQRDGAQRPTGERLRPVHVVVGARRDPAHRVPRRRQAGLADDQRLRPRRQAHPIQDLLLELLADHRHRPDRPSGGVARTLARAIPPPTGCATAGSPP